MHVVAKLCRYFQKSVVGLFPLLCQKNTHRIEIDLLNRFVIVDLWDTGRTVDYPQEPVYFVTRVFALKLLVEIKAIRQAP